jgi:predicted HTH transcriptional regulator
MSSVASRGDGNDDLYQKVCALVADKHQITNADLLTTLGCTLLQARKVLKRLVEENVAVKEGRGRSTRYVAVSSAEARNAHPTGRAD